MYADPDGNWVEVKTTKYYSDSKGNLIQKTSFRDLFRKTTYIEKEIIIHDAKVYFADPVFQEGGDDFKQQWISTFQRYIKQGTSGSGSVIKYEDVTDQVTGAVKTLETPVKGACVTVRFADPIKEVSQASEIKRTDNLYVIAPVGEGDLEYMGKALKGSDAQGESPLGSNAILLQTTSAHRQASHEQFHGLGLDHEDMPMDNQQSDEYRTNRKIGNRSDDREKVNEMKGRLLNFERIKNKTEKK